MWSIKQLLETIDCFMRSVVDGEMFGNEQDFEDALREKLENECFTVLPKQNVANTQATLNQRSFAAVQNQIPDIVVRCDDGVVFLELKFCATPQEYADDVSKVQNYVQHGACTVGGVLFLDYGDHLTRGKVCQANRVFEYLFQTFSL